MKGVCNAVAIVLLMLGQSDVRVRGDLGLRQALVNNVQRGAVPSCGDLSELEAGASCTIPWFKLKKVAKPTQAAVGFAWVQSKFEKGFTKADDAQKEMKSSPIPVALKNGIPYVVDHHHTLCALDLSGFSDTLVTLSVSCVLSDTTDIWKTLADQGKAYLYASPKGGYKTLPVAVNPETYAAWPATFLFTEEKSTFADDPYRSLTSFTRKIKDKKLCKNENEYCNRCFDRICNNGQTIPFFEFRWGIFFNDAYKASDLWPSVKEHNAFSTEFPALTKTTDVDAWTDFAFKMLPLCRGKSAGTYKVPALYKGFKGTLPGNSSTIILHPDPDCDSPSCQGN